MSLMKCTVRYLSLLRFVEINVFYFIIYYLYLICGTAAWAGSSALRRTRSSTGSE
jgi:hypothetical protein